VARYDRLSDRNSAGIPSFSEWYYGPEYWQMLHYNFKNYSSSLFYDHISFDVNQQHFIESRHSRKYKQSNLKVQEEDVNALCANIDLRKTHNLHFTSDYGVEAIYNHVKSQAKIINILNQVESSTTSRYPDGGSNYSSLGIYFSEKINLSKNLLLYSGARWTATNIKSKTNDPFFVQFIDRSFSVKNNAFTGSLGLNYTLHQHHIFSTSLSQGFRSPNVDDLGKIFESTVGQITIPNSKLNPEKALTYDLTYNYRNKNLTLEMNLFYTWLTDAITLEQTQLNNQDSIYLFDTWNKIFSLQNKQSANIYGASYQVKWKLNDQWMINHDLTYTVGKISSDKSPLDHIPPIVGNLGINYMHNHTELSLLTQFNGNKPLSNYRLNTEDNEKYATPYGTLGWMTFTVRASKIFKDQYKVVASIDNILDTQYRRFGSGISSTGRNFVISFIYGK
ncbi:MAG: TonB-dependent receptor, partial [Saprospiraceae bacterium]|nr:TonB-dependent receptor [Saprospiraceae bacterium]